MGSIKQLNVAIGDTGLRDLRAELEAIVGPAALITKQSELRTYECDGLTSFRVAPALAVLPSSTEQVAAVVRACHAHKVPFVARGAGTGLSGGALPVAEGVLIVLSRMTRIIDVDPLNRRVVVEPGVTNLGISLAVRELGLYYAPDPSSQVVCSIGGNVAENSGGAHCLKYGFTTNHVLGLEVVLPDGSIVELGGDDDRGGFDLLGFFIGSEGTLGIATQITLRLMRIPETVRTLVADFGTIAEAGSAVSDIVGVGIIPAAVEMMDQLAIAACEDATHAGYSRGTAAALIVEVDGPEVECAETFAEVRRICEGNGATKIRVAGSPEERALIWKGRKAAFAAVGRISPDYIVQDGVIPRTKLAPVLQQIADMAAEAGLRVANVFHAGDGNLHPLVLYDRKLGETERAEELATRIVEVCVENGGSITGEHGVGAHKACSMPKMFSAADLDVMMRVRSAFDPDGICNPGKIFPTPRLCGESPGPYRQHPLEAAGVISRM